MLYEVITLPPLDLDRVHPKVEQRRDILYEEIGLVRKDDPALRQLPSYNFV